MILFFGAILAGALTGIVTGIVPGLHINTVAFVLSLVSLFEGNLVFAVFLMSMSVAHNFFDFIPAIVFGAGEESSALSTFAGNRMFLEGSGVRALKLTAFGGLVGTSAFLALTPVLGVVLPVLFTFLADYAWILLAGISAHLLFLDAKKEALFVFFASGILGLFALNSTLSFPLLSLFSGLFGLGIMWEHQRTQPVLQRESYGLPLEKKDLLKAGVFGVVSGIILGVVPAIGPTQASVVLYSKKDENEFLVRLGAINVADVFISLLTLFFAGSARSGVLVIMQEFFVLSAQSMLFLFVAGFLSAVVSFFVCLRFGTRIIKHIATLNYGHLVRIVVFAILMLNFVSNGVLGVVVCVSGALISRVAIRSKSMKSHAMGCLIVPTLIGYVLRAM